MKGGPAEAVLGPVLIGLVFNILLSGIMIAQLYIYYTTYKSDRTWIKVFILVLYLVDTFNAVMNIIFVYDSLITHFGDLPYIGSITWSLATDPVTTGVIAVMVQLFYAWRIHVLIQNWLLVGVVVVLSLASGAASIAETVRVYVVKDYTRFQEKDITRKNKTGFKNSDTLIDRLIRVTAQTGLITAIVSVVNIALVLSDPTASYLIVNTPLCKLYSNSLMSSLNSRGGWKFNEGSILASRTVDGDISFQTQSTPHFRPFDTTASTNDPRGFNVSRTKPEVFVHVESHEMQDGVLPRRKQPPVIPNDHEPEGDLSSFEEGRDSKYSGILHRV
ncbi:hypothetical protein NP233_g2514 [Leucocoprinus birnbaumii]|uniref:DUF6534 domain-containing protein n=1 Tax=Leucocoprinus birnbaumii TaxID=56174 RepID=A0AAD5W1A7_9AGAR|nr:hypothetical protein NP233_g2514 [Leucocoprinus birnbaumii]